MDARSDTRCKHMRKTAVMMSLLLVVLAAGPESGAQPANSTRAEMRSLDEQVQTVKSDVLAISRDLGLLEERLLYPSGTQLAVFVALDSGQAFRLDAVQLEIDGDLAAHYIYSFKELEALEQGGVQRVYTGNVPTGSHELTVSVNGKLGNGDEFTSTESFTFSKTVEPKLLGLTLAAGTGRAAIELGDW